MVAHLRWMWSLTCEIVPLFLLTSSLYHSSQRYLLPSRFLIVSPHLFSRSDLLWAIFYISNHTEKFTRVLDNFLVFLALRLVQPKDLWTGGWGKLWNLLFALDWQNVSIFTSVHVVYRVEEQGTLVPKAAQLGSSWARIAVSLRDPPLTVSRSPFCNLWVALRLGRDCLWVLSRNLAVILMWLASIVPEKN